MSSIVNILLTSAHAVKVIFTSSTKTDLSARHFIQYIYNHACTHAVKAILYGAHDLLQVLKQEKMIQENRFSRLNDNLPNL